MKMKLTALIATLTLIVCCTTSNAQPPSVRESVVPLLLGDVVICTGFVIAPEYVLTADHCLLDGVVSVDGVLAVEEVFHGGEAMDVAVIKLGKPTTRPALKPDMSRVLPLTMLSYGYPNGQPTLKTIALKTSLGGFSFPDLWGWWIQAMPNIERGMSGGPIVNEAGEVVALNQLTSDANGTTLSRLMGPIYEVTKEFWAYGK